MNKVGKETRGPRSMSRQIRSLSVTKKGRADIFASSSVGTGQDKHKKRNLRLLTKRLYFESQKNGNIKKPGIPIPAGAAIPPGPGPKRKNTLQRIHISGKKFSK